MSDQYPQYPSGGSPQPAGPPPYGSPPPYGNPPSQYGQPPQQQQPGYGNPAPYGQPPQQSTYGNPPAQYGQPQQSGYGTPPPYGQTPGGPGYGETPPKKSRTSLWIAIGVVLVLLVGGGIGLYAFLSPSKAAQAERKAHVSTPAKIGNLTLSTDSSDADGAKSTESDFTGELQSSAKESVSGFYSDPSDPTKIVLLVAATADVSDPDKQLKTIFEDPTADITNLHSVDAGKLGGSAECANAEASGQTAVVCAWADHGSVGATFIFNRPAAESETLFRQIREAVLTRD